MNETQQPEQSLSPGKGEQTPSQPDLGQKIIADNYADNYKEIVANNLPKFLKVLKEVSSDFFNKKPPPDFSFDYNTINPNQLERLIEASLPFLLPDQLQQLSKELARRSITSDHEKPSEENPPASGAPDTADQT